MSGWYILVSCVTASVGITFFLKLVADEAFVMQQSLDRHEEHCAKELRRKQDESSESGDVIEVQAV